MRDVCMFQQQEEADAARAADEKVFLDSRAAATDDDGWINPVVDELPTFDTIKELEYE
jgi:hypothetical protein